MGMAKPRNRVLPLLPLLMQYRTVAQAHRAPQRYARLAHDAVDQLPDQSFVSVLVQLAERALPVLFHRNVLQRQTPFLRHALAHLSRGQDPFPERLARCAVPGEVYHIPGLGPAFWCVIAHWLDPTRPVWWPAVGRGLRAFGLVSDCPRTFADRYSAVANGVAAIRETAPDLSPAEVSDFLTRISVMSGRELPLGSFAAWFGWSASPQEIQQAVREVRTRLPLRKRRDETPPRVIEAVSRFVAESRAGNHGEAFEAFREATRDSEWEAALPALDDAYSPLLSLTDRARLWCDVADVLRASFRVHPLELADVVARVGRTEESSVRHAFRGFCSDTFAFLSELTDNNSRDWMTANRERYQFVLREPLIELCDTVAERYIRPVLNREYDWDLECDARTGRALTSICKNDFGRSGPYQPVQWVTFYRRSRANKRADAQFFVRVSADGVRYGFHLGRSARDAGGQFRQILQQHGEGVFQALAPGRSVQNYRFWVGDDLETEVAVRSAADLRAWATHKTIAAGIHRSTSDSVLRSEDLPGDVLLTFDRLLPLFLCAAEANAQSLLARRAGSPETPAPYDSAAFQRETYLSEAWLDRVAGLLRLKKQLILQGVPGTGKTHVARCLARLLTHDRAACVRLVQFHPAYSYEEFVEGIRVRNVEKEGRSEVAYPVEDGLLCEFAKQAASRPGEPHVLIVDELNRGNLPRIFGELLFLLEYRDQEVVLPYSKRPFRLPENLLVLGTMNPMDRSAVSLDQALLRRFSFVEMPADAVVLARWLEHHPPQAPGDETFGPRVVRLFEELNLRLEHDLGPGRQVGHSFFMVPELNRDKLAAVWDHHIRPLLLDYLGGREDRLRSYDPAHLLNETAGKKAKPRRGG
jgi:MoxR-like ATPase